MKKYYNFIREVLAQLKMVLIKNVLLKFLIKDATHPNKIQTHLLKNILRKNKNTEFGKKYNFSSINEVSEFINQIPICEYEELRPYIEKQISTNKYFIVAQKPLLYAQTSGSTGKAKHIPIIKKTIYSYKRAQKIFSYIQYRDVPEIFSGKILAIVSPAIEGYLSNKTPYGSMSGLVYQNMPNIISSKYILPQLIFNLTDYESKYLLIAAFALCEKSISCLATANPSTLLKIAEIINKDFEFLTDFVATANIDILNLNISSKQKEEIIKYCRANPSRASELKRIKDSKDDITFSDIWPDLKAVVTWMSGNCGLLLPRLQKQLSPKTKIIEMGYLSSEFRGTITIDCHQNLGIPTIQDNFFEFAEVENWDNGNKQTLLLSELKLGKQYYIIVTTSNGLYRYFINDIIKVTGYFKNTPTIAFVQKGKGVTSLTGEKLYENQVIEAAKQTFKNYNIDSDLFIMIADQEHFSYIFYIECENISNLHNFKNSFNKALGKLNLEYLSKAKSGRIKFSDVKQLKEGTFEEYKNFCVKSGQREGQFKTIKLQYRSNVSFPFEKYLQS